MAAYDSTQALELLGKTVSVTEVCEHIVTSASGVVLAVLVPAPGAPVAVSILVGECYFDLDECSITVH